MTSQQKVKTIIKLLAKRHPNAKCELDFKNPFELLVATILSAQCTDVRVNIVTKTLFKQFPGPGAFASASLAKIEKAIRTTGFYKNKAKSLKNASAIILKEYNGKVPNKMEELVKLPGVGRKTANVVLGNAYGVPGIAVDTHVIRVANRLGLVHTVDPIKIEIELARITPEQHWTKLSHLLIIHGRYVCMARRALCDTCPIAKYCSACKK